MHPLGGGPMPDLLEELQRWYSAQCDGDWEHDNGVSIDSLDNPGWTLTVDLDGTLLSNKEFKRIDEEHGDGTWLACFVENNQFKAAGDPAKLGMLIKIFLEWAKTESDWLGLPSNAKSDDAQARRTLESYGEESGPEVCQIDGCTRKRVPYSVLCRKHHYEQVMGRAAPDEVV